MQDILTGWKLEKNTCTITEFVIKIKGMLSVKAELDKLLFTRFWLQYKRYYNVSIQNPKIDVRKLVLLDM